MIAGPFWAGMQLLDLIDKSVAEGPPRIHRSGLNPTQRAIMSPSMSLWQSKQCTTVGGEALVSGCYIGLT